LGVVVPVWSRWATYAVAVLLLTGVAQALVEVASLDALTGTRYGWLVLAKVGLVGAALAVAVFARRLVLPIAAAGDPYPGIDHEPGYAGPDTGADDPDADDPDGDDPDADDPDADDTDDDDPDGDDPDGDAGTGHPAGGSGPVRVLRRLVAVEAAVALVVLGVAAALVQTTPGRSAQAGSAVPTVQSAKLRTDLFTLIVDVQPGQVGINYVHLYANTPDGQPADVKEWRGFATLAGQNLERIDIDLLAITADHATGQVGLIAPGPWTLTFTLRTSEIDQASVEMPVIVSD
jgi:copper transport protein